jgi:hypothetical protein
MEDKRWWDVPTPKSAWIVVGVCAVIWLILQIVMVEGIVESVIGWLGL